MGGLLFCEHIFPQAFAEHLCVGHDFHFFLMDEMDEAIFLRDDDDEGIGCLGEADGGLMAHSELQADVFFHREGKLACSAFDLASADDDASVMQRTALVEDGFENGVVGDDGGAQFSSFETVFREGDVLFDGDEGSRLCFGEVFDGMDDGVNELCHLAGAELVPLGETAELPFSRDDSDDVAEFRLVEDGQDDGKNGEEFDDDELEDAEVQIMGE